MDEYKSETSINEGEEYITTIIVMAMYNIAAAHLQVHQHASQHPQQPLTPRV